MPTKFKIKAGPPAFTGQLGDGALVNATDYFPERQYRPTQGRWLAPDPAGLGAVDPSDPQSWNRYAYVRNSPLDRVDPLGLDWDEWGGGGWGGFDFGISFGSGGISFGGGIFVVDNCMGMPCDTRFGQQLRAIASAVNDRNWGALLGLAGGSVAGSCETDFGAPCEQTGAVGFSQGQLAVAGAGTLETICIVLEPCGATELLIVGGVVVVGVAVATMPPIDLKHYFSKGGKQNVAHDYVRDMAMALGGDYCSALKSIMNKAKQDGNSKLFNDAKATWKQDCRGN